MANAVRVNRTTRRIILVLFGALILTACDRAFEDTAITNVAINAEGEIVGLTSHEVDNLLIDDREIERRTADRPATATRLREAREALLESIGGPLEEPRLRTNLCVAGTCVRIDEMSTILEWPEGRRDEIETIYEIDIEDRGSATSRPLASSTTLSGPVSTTF